MGRWSIPSYFASTWWRNWEVLFYFQRMEKTKVITHIVQWKSSGNYIPHPQNKSELSLLDTLFCSVWKRRLLLSAALNVQEESKVSTQKFGLNFDGESKCLFQSSSLIMLNLPWIDRRVQSSSVLTWAVAVSRWLRNGSRQRTTSNFGGTFVEFLLLVSKLNLLRKRTLVI